MEVEALRLGNLKQLLEEAGWSREDLADKLGHKNAGTVGHWFMSSDREGFRPITSPMARRIERVAGKDRGWLDIDWQTARAEQPLSRYAAEPAPRTGVIEVARYREQPSMGRGRGQVVQYVEPIIDRVQIDEEWIRRNLPNITSPKNLRLITGRGDSMEPTFRDSDPLLMDSGIREVDIDAVYVFTLSDELFIKTIQRIPGDGYKVISDNRKYDPYVISEASKKDLAIHGRIAGIWNWRKL